MIISVRQGWRISSQRRACKYIRICAWIFMYFFHWKKIVVNASELSGFRNAKSKICICVTERDLQKEKSFGSRSTCRHYTARANRIPNVETYPHWKPENSPTNKTVFETKQRIKGNTLRYTRHFYIFRLANNKQQNDLANRSARYFWGQSCLFLGQWNNSLYINTT